MTVARTLKLIERARSLFAGEISVRELAEQIGVSQPLLHMVVRGERRPTEELQLKLAATCRQAALTYMARAKKLQELADDIEASLARERSGQ